MIDAHGSSPGDFASATTQESKMMTREYLERLHGILEERGMSRVDTHLLINSHLEVLADNKRQHDQIVKLLEICKRSFAREDALYQLLVDTVHGIALVLNYDRDLVGMDHNIVAALPDQSDLNETT